MSIRCDVVLSPSETLPEADCWLVIDILRATTTMCAYFDGGGKRLYPAESIEEAFTLRDRLAREENAPLLMGERNSLPPPGFDLGNSPLELLAAAPATRPDAVMATTNGTRALLKAASSGAKVYPVCARNANATLRAALGAGERIGILCAGLYGRPAMDDAACAGLLAEQLLGQGAVLDDGAKMALSVWQAGMRNLSALLGASVHGGRLLSLGFAPDMAYAAEIDASNSVLVLSEVKELPCIVPGNTPAA